MAADEFSELIGPDGTVEQLATGFEFVEGPVWSPSEDCVYFSDILGDTRRSWSEARGIVEVKRPNNKGNGMTFDALGRLIVCEHSTSLVVREAAGEREVIASHFDGRELNSPNDVVVAGDGSIFFSDPIFGRTASFGVERDPQLDFRGVFRLPAAGGDLELVAGDFGQPNGLCFAPGGSVLYVNDTPGGLIRRFEVGTDGAASGGEVFFEGISGGPNDGRPDGMKCDEHGNVYVTGPGGIWVISPDARKLGVIEVPERVANLNWGGPGWRQLYITASTSLYRATLAVGGNRSSYMEGSP